MTSLNSSHFYFTDKPQGISTHQVDSEKPGWVEYCEIKSGQKLWVIHRLDKTTSGCLVFAKSPEIANNTRKLFENHSVQKRYLFITDRASHEAHYEVRGLIYQKDKKFDFNPSVTQDKANSLTRFNRIKRSPFFELWEAIPVTGKPHQIRLHAAYLNLPILGDVEYGGSSFPTLCLHAAQFNLTRDLCHQSPPPLYFERLGLLKDPLLIDWLSQLDQRQRIYQFLQDRNQAIRGFISQFQDYRFVLDLLGDYAWLHCYPGVPDDPRFSQRVNLVSTLINRPIQIYARPNPGQIPQAAKKRLNQNFPERWEIEENGYRLELRSNQGAHYGIFLDQRLNRKFIRSIAKEKTVLNLFCYTAGFSVAAAMGNAKHITNVDISKTYLEWGKRNFLLNGLDPNRHQWIKFDATLFLKKLALKPPSLDPQHPNRFDIVICDPPTFARTDKGVFRLEKEYLNLIKLGFDILLPKGVLIFSCNVETLTPSSFKDRVTKILPNEAKIEILPLDWDYALGTTFGASKVLKISKP